MRTPLSALQAFTYDAEARSCETSGTDRQLAEYFAVARMAERLSLLDTRRQKNYLAGVPADMLPHSDARPTLIHDTQDRPTDALARLAERFRVEAEGMERAGCFEMAFATVSAVCRIAANADLATRMLAAIHLGRIARQLGDVESATDCYEMAADVSLRERDAPLAARAYIGLGVVAAYRGNRPAERKMFERALSLCHPGSPTEAMASQGMMNVALAEGRLIDALLHGWRAFDLFPEGDEDRAMIMSNLALASLHGSYNSAALRGFLHALTLTNIARIRLPAVGGAIRAAARIGSDIQVTTLNASGNLEAARANMPYESARFLMHAGEAFETIGEIEIAWERLREAFAIAIQHSFFELQVKVENALDSLDRVVAEGRDRHMKVSSSLTSDSVDNSIIKAGIGRLEALCV